jgi:cytochrome c biogenesis protein CcmG, thiol:disulfide interchange protein DsbE
MISWPDRSFFGVLYRCIAALLLAVGPLPVLAQSELRPWTGVPEAPPIELKTLEGQPLSLAELRGKIVVVNFWATWCEPCIEEMPSLQRLRQALAGEPFEILAVNYQEGEPRIRAFLQKVALTFPILRDADGGVARAWRVRIFPSSFVVDPEGRIRYVLVGSLDWATRDMQKTLRALLRSPRPGGPRQ